MKFNERVQQILSEGNKVTKGDIEINKIISKAKKDKVWDKEPNILMDGNMYKMDGLVDGEPFSIEYKTSAKKSGNAFLIYTIGPYNDQLTPNSVAKFITNQSNDNNKIQMQNAKEAKQILKDFGFTV